MSALRCETCNQDIPHGEVAMCETCERAFCVECIPEHSCAVAVKKELYGLFRKRGKE